MHYITNNYDITYNDYKYKNDTTIESELLRKYFYENCVQEFNIDTLSEKKKKEVFFYFVIHNNSKDDPIINKDYKFDIKYIENILKKNIKDYANSVTSIKKELKKIKTIMNGYTVNYNKLIKKCKPCFMAYISNKDDIIILKLEKICDDDFYLDVSNISFSIHISLYKHLYKMFMIRNNKDGDDWIDDFHNKVFILYCRYNYLTSGSTQASIQPKLKKKLTELLNTKVELFASAINSSYMNYGSLFFDIEKYFGSLGSYFTMKIKAGYYEANPPFEYDIIYNMFAKMIKELDTAENNKRNLLFVIIIPKMDLSSIPNYNKYLKYEKLLHKSDINYVYYDSSFTYAITRNIIDTYFIIYHTSYIKEPIKRNITRVI